VIGFNGVDVDAMLPVAGGLAKLATIGQVKENGPGTITESMTVEQLQAGRLRELLGITTPANRALTTAEIIAELVKLAEQMRDQNDRHNKLGLSVAEAAFYDAIVQNDAAILQMGDDVLKKIAVDLVWAVQQSATIDWSLKESVRATMRSKVRRLLAKYDYPPEYEERQSS
jgi:type I restriction enzyme R subunit